MKNHTIRKINIDMCDLKRSYPSMYKDILGVLIEEADGTADYDALKAKE